MIVGHIGGGAAGGYQIEKSLRFRAAASAYLSRTVGPGGGTTKNAISLWVKRGALGVQQGIFQGRQDGNNQQYIGFTSGGSIEVGIIAGGTQVLQKISTPVFRDPSAWYHIYFYQDNTIATAEDRYQIWVNGVRITAWGTNINTAGQNTSYFFGTANPHYIGSYGGVSSFLDGHVCEFVFVYQPSGMPLVSSFGEFNADGVWVPKKYTGTYGTNGFYLPFNDGTNLTELCRDRSGNGNHWTANNISLTAGATYDWMDDTPTNNFCRFSPIDKSGASFHQWSSAVITSSVASTPTLTRGTFGVSSGKWYWEGRVSNAITDFYHGVQTNSASLTAQTTSSFHVNQAGQCYVDGALVTTFPGSAVQNDVIGVALDLDGGTISWYRNNVLWGSRSIGANTWFPVTGNFSTGSAQVINFGAHPFAYTPPTGFKALSTKNRPSVTIADPRQHHTVIAVTKSGDTNFTLPWNATDFDTLFWIKRRDASGDWYQIDGLRGYDKILKSNSTAAETTDANVLGVSGTTCTLKSTLPNGTYVIYAWKAGRVSERQTNTDGSITSTVSRNVTAGFSIVTYTGTGANATVGHGLGNAPKMVVWKVTSNPSTWGVYHASRGATKYLELNSTAAEITLTTNWLNSTEPSSTVLTLGIGSVNNQTGNTHVAYCHTEIPSYSKFGSYIGNGSTDGPFVWGDVSVMDVMVKRSDVSGTSWVVHDSSRSPQNSSERAVYPNLSSAEVSPANAIDILSTGLKIRNTSAEFNTSGGTYIYAAYARHPFGAENVSPATAR